MHGFRVDRLTAASLVVGFFLFFTFPVHALTELSDQSLQSITAREGLLFDLEDFRIYAQEIDFKDFDGDSSGTLGAVAMSNVALDDQSGSSIDLTGMTLDADDDVSVGGTPTSAVVWGLPTISSPSRFQIESTYICQPGGSTNTCGGIGGSYGRPPSLGLQWINPEISGEVAISAH